MIVLIDDAGPGLPTTFGGEGAHRERWTGSAPRGSAITGSIPPPCGPPTRALLLTGRNHHEIGNGQIAELANYWDGYAGKIPANSSSLVAEVLPATTGIAPAHGGNFTTPQPRRPQRQGRSRTGPTGLGFENRHGFLAGEASQYEPNLVPNTTVGGTAEDAPAGLPPPRRTWPTTRLPGCATTKRCAPTNRFCMYWQAGGHGPHHIMKEWADR